MEYESIFIEEDLGYDTGINKQIMFTNEDSQMWN